MGEQPVVVAAVKLAVCPKDTALIRISKVRMVVPRINFRSFKPSGSFLKVVLIKVVSQRSTVTKTIPRLTGL